MKLTYCDCCAKRIGIREKWNLSGYHRKAEPIKNLSISIDGEIILNLDLCEKCYKILKTEVNRIEEKVINIWKETTKGWFKHYKPKPKPSKWQRIKDWFSIQLKERNKDG